MHRVTTTTAITTITAITQVIIIITESKHDMNLTVCSYFERKILLCKCNICCSLKSGTYFCTHLNKLTVHFKKMFIKLSVNFVK